MVTQTLSPSFRAFVLLMALLSFQKITGKAAKKRITPIKTPTKDPPSLDPKDVVVVLVTLSDMVVTSEMRLKVVRYFSPFTLSL